MSNLIVGTNRENIMQEILVDKDTNALVITTTVNENIHRGIVFEAYKKVTLASNASEIIAIIIPDNIKFHFIGTEIVTSADNVTIVPKLGAAITGGNSINIFNLNHEYINPVDGLPINDKYKSKVTLVDTPTINTAGYQFTQIYLGGSTGVGQSRGGASYNLNIQRNLVSNTTYTYTITNDSTVSNTIQINAFWEEIPL